METYLLVPGGSIETGIEKWEELDLFHHRMMKIVGGSESEKRKEFAGMMNYSQQLWLRL